MKHRKPNRLKNYDYSQPGWYFVTICTHDKLPHFGRINDGVLILNQYGELAHKYWLEIADHFNGVELDEFVIMPNHVHGIIIIHDIGEGDTSAGDALVGDALVGDAYMRPLHQPMDRTKMLLSKVIGQYKAAVTREIHKMDNRTLFRWQRSFYDHIIRNDFALFKIRTYIQNNPVKWIFDRENNNEISLADKKRFWQDYFLQAVVN